jgi:hypothetical protein
VDREAALVDLELFQGNFPPGVDVPSPLSSLLEFQNRSKEWYSGYFELTEWKYGYTAWFGDDKEAAEQFAVFGKGGDGSLYALWLYSGRTVADAPVVFLGSEGVDCGLLASDLIGFLGLLTIGADELGFAVSWGGDLEPKRPAPRLEEFRAWLRESFGVGAPPNLMAAVGSARALHPDFGAWLARWQASH